MPSKEGEQQTSAAIEAGLLSEAARSILKLYLVVDKELWQHEEKAKGVHTYSAEQPMRHSAVL